MNIIIKILVFIFVLSFTTFSYMTLEFLPLLLDSPSQLTIEFFLLLTYSPSQLTILFFIITLFFHKKTSSTDHNSEVLHSLERQEERDVLFLRKKSLTTAIRVFIKRLFFLNSFFLISYLLCFFVNPSSRSYFEYIKYIVKGDPLALFSFLTLFLLIILSFYVFSGVYHKKGTTLVQRIKTSHEDVYKNEGMPGRILTFLFLIAYFWMLRAIDPALAISWLIVVLLILLTYISGFILLFYKKGEGVMQNVIGAIKVVVARNKDMIVALFAFFSLSYANIFLSIYIKDKNDLLYTSVFTLFLLAILYGKKKNRLKERVKDLFNIGIYLGKKVLCSCLCLITFSVNLLLLFFLAYALLQCLCFLFDVPFVFRK